MLTLIVLVPVTVTAVVWLTTRAIEQARSQGYAMAIHDVADVVDYDEVTLIEAVTQNKRKQLLELHIGGKNHSQTRPYSVPTA